MKDMAERAKEDLGFCAPDLIIGSPDHRPGSFRLCGVGLTATWPRREEIAPATLHRTSYTEHSLYVTYVRTYGTYKTHHTDGRTEISLLARHRMQRLSLSIGLCSLTGCMARPSSASLQHPGMPGFSNAKRWEGGEGRGGEAWEGTEQRVEHDLRRDCPTRMAGGVAPSCPSRDVGRKTLDASPTFANSVASSSYIRDLTVLLGCHILHDKRERHPLTRRPMPSLFSESLALT